jgi:hypothetical protein
MQENFLRFYKQTVLAAGYEVAPAPKPHNTSFIVRAVNWPHKIGPFGTEEESYVKACEELNLDVDFEVDAFTAGFIEGARLTAFGGSEDRHRKQANFGFDLETCERIILTCQDFQERAQGSLERHFGRGATNDLRNAGLAFWKARNASDAQRFDFVTDADDANELGEMAFRYGPCAVEIEDGRPEVSMSITPKGPSMALKR